MHVQPISTFRMFQEGHLLRNSIAIFVLTTLFYFIGAELRLVHELSLFWPLNGVMAGVFAQHIQKIVGDKGLVARMGGEEFAVAVPSVNPVDGLLMAEKIRKGVELQPFTWQQKTLYLTVSIGVGSGCASYRTLTDDFNKLMVEADTCLYRSKKDGRNRTSTMRYGEEVV
ncbi:putative signal transduction protein [Escherichia coli]|uniref:diguanylate cyclase n=2 Tax=Escherichia coli TaxID=562 RepID=A0AB38GUR4_ECOLX|nr:diguanylate cyclase domain protein [Escherichia coli DEC1C]EHU14843.1 diguanylate cyclase domain protein [Escherichia coli DEC1B]EHU25815.1 diguanylate cyclase domain protein [Escherichia coli DEC1D]EHU27892.1 diguanylate cyclase domain protein [Escherichia coli DEC1E]EHU30121.1 diguanylate cyclase domain protein [Escherichia coli DEC2A]EHU40940.1 diguanylate cyclase domain protein [Escherichia coli DEC2B]EHU45900.1 diguanylate cyclase domain protein [Escherichia coli DEC2C]EHU46066.1 dig